MTRIVTIVLLAISLAAAFAAGAFLNAPATLAGQASGKVLYWFDPMHPDYRSDQPGVAPDCGMRLEPAYADSQPRAAARADVPAGAVRISSDKQQVIGVRSQIAERSAGQFTVRTPGRVTADERRIYRLNAFTGGWIRKTYSQSVGSLVADREVLATFYAREFLAAQQSYFYALDALDRRAGAGDQQLVATRAQVQGAADSLHALGMSELQVAELARTRQATQEIDLRSPAGGFLLARNVSPGQRIDGGQELFVVADLTHVWVLADMFQHEANFIGARQVVRILLPHQGREFSGRVSDVLPQFDPATRTLKVRIDVANPAFALRPGMFVDVQFPLNLPEALSVPSDAVVDSGLRQTVFVDLGDGYFEPRPVETGWRLGGRVEIVRGLMPGERIVTAGTFLIDSESRLRSGSAGGSAARARDPVCGMDVEAARARDGGLVAVHAARSHYFCSATCRDRFAADPAKYAAAR